MEREIYQNPTVKEVIFQIKYSDLFSIEKNIGDFQMKIMDRFPISKFKVRRQFIFADLGPNMKIEELPDVADQPNLAQKIWHFQSEKGIEVNVTINSLDITSKYHKTYDIGDGEKFKDTIEFVVAKFLEIFPISIITRIGLRYIDECPIKELKKEEFNKCYNTSFPLDRFDLQDVEGLESKTKVKKEDFYLVYIEKLMISSQKPVLILDFDGFAENIKANNYLAVTDDLHNLIHDEYERTITDKLREYMRRGK